MTRRRVLLQLLLALAVQLGSVLVEGFVRPLLWTTTSTSGVLFSHSYLTSNSYQLENGSGNGGCNDDDDVSVMGGILRAGNNKPLDRRSAMPGVGAAAAASTFLVAPSSVGAKQVC